MNALTNWKIKNKLIAIIVLMSNVPIFIAAAFILSTIVREIKQSEERNLANTIDIIYQMYESQEKTLNAKTVSDLHTAMTVMQSFGTLTVDESSPVKFQAINQFNTKEVVSVSLPGWKAGNQAIHNDYTIVDKIQKIAGGTCTIFQKMPGDHFLRISTNVLKLDGERAVGTFIPSDSPVVKAVLRGETYQGKAFVVNQDYVTAYMPIRSGSGEIIGILYVGVPLQEYLAAIEKTIGTIMIGKTGGIYAFNSNGIVKIHRTATGQDWSAKQFFQEIKSQKNGALRFVADGEKDMQVAAYRYFAPWDLFIIASSYEKEFLTAAAVIKRVVGILGFIFAIISVVIAALFARTINGPISQLVKNLKDLANGNFAVTVLPGLLKRQDEMGMIANAVQDTKEKVAYMIRQLYNATAELGTATANIAESTRKISDGAQQQSASFEELSGSVQSNANNASQVNDITQHTATAADETGRYMESTLDAIRSIETGSKQIATAVEIITDIADQTNLLALNAAIEAARAGEHGKGFAVVADEVRKLAERSANSAKEIVDLIRASSRQVETGVSLSQKAGENIKKIVDEINMVARQIQMISQSTQEQAASMEENTSITESNAAVAENLSSAIEVMASHTGNLMGAIKQFKIDERDAA
ncbi:MAG: Cache 3/Cache 2 fusion domain-containing protein [Candidatus Omnitrophica bacterium]|nr:Cache 3/Cache 2 fusion domain-containing protein [Candidatus Omnitrophota bacterium]